MKKVKQCFVGFDVRVEEIATEVAVDHVLAIVGQEQDRAVTFDLPQRLLGPVVRYTEVHRSAARLSA